MATRGPKKSKARAKKPRTEEATEPAERERYRRFVEAYMGVAAGDQGKAARIAGYEGTDDSMSERGRRLLLRDDIRAMLAERRAECSLVASREELQEAWSRTVRWQGVKLGKGKKLQYPNYKEWLRAGELLGKSLGIFVEKKEIEHKGGVRIFASIPANGRDEGT